MGFSKSRWDSKQELWKYLQDTIQEAKNVVHSNEAKNVLEELQEREEDFKISGERYTFHDGQYWFQKDGEPVMLILTTEGGKWLAKEIQNLGLEERKSLWVIATSLFFGNAEGRVVVEAFVMRPDIVWSAVGLPSLLLNEKISHINGRLRESYLNHAIQFGLSEAQHALEEQLLKPPYLRPDHLPTLDNIYPSGEDCMYWGEVNRMLVTSEFRTLLDVHFHPVSKEDFEAYHAAVGARGAVNGHISAVTYRFPSRAAEILSEFRRVMIYPHLYVQNRGDNLRYTQQYRDIFASIIKRFPLE